MDILFFENITGKQEYIDFVEHIVKECSEEFFPPLLGRSSTQQKSFGRQPSSNDKHSDKSYINNLLMQSNIFAIVDNNIAGFMSFIYDCHNEIFDKLGYGKNNYITTICVEPKFRGRGIANALYDFIEQKLPLKSKADFTSTRTWSGNKSHLSLLDRRGYSLIHKIKDDREYQGQKADSVYYARKNT